VRRKRAWRVGGAVEARVSEVVLDRLRCLANAVGAKRAQIVVTDEVGRACVGQLEVEQQLSDITIGKD
jgi:hypothetical protein